MLVYNLQVRGVIVQFILIFMMNMLPFFQPPSQSKLHDYAMYSYLSVSPWPRDVGVTVVVPNSQAHPIDGYEISNYQLAVVGYFDVHIPQAWHTTSPLCQFRAGS
jgi:hypothetical protein